MSQVFVRLIFGFLILTSISSRAAKEILFLDFNFAVDEFTKVEKFAADETAKGRPTKVTRIPEVSTEDIKLKRKLFSDWARIGYEMKKSGCSATKKCVELSAKADAISADLSALVKRNNISSKELAARIGQACKEKKFDMLQMSGHDGTGEFYGDLSSLPMNEFNDLIKNNKECLGKGIKSIFLWGCYTGTPGKLSCLWKPNFPNATFLAGFDTMSPRSDREINYKMLGELLEKHDEVLSEATAARTSKIFNKIGGLNSTNASVYLPSCDCYYRQGSTRKLEDARIMDCSSAKKGAANVRKVFNCYLSGSAKCENPPENTGSSELRDAYNFLQKSEQCLESDPTKILCDGPSDSETPDTHRTIRLIFYRTVLGNFAVNDKKLIEQYRDSLSHLNLDDKVLKTLNLPNLVKKDSEPQATRKQILEWAKSTRHFLSSQLPSPQIDQLQKSFSQIEAKLVELKCVPFGWVEPGADIPPNC